MVEDLEENPHVKKHRSLGALKKIVGGDGATLRASKPALAQPYLDVSAQADVLVDALDMDTDRPPPTVIDLIPPDRICCVCGCAGSVYQ